MLSSGGSGFPQLIAIRYLAGILELPGFWSEDYKVQKFTMDKLCQQTLRLIEDITPGSATANDSCRLDSLAPDGVDALAAAVLVGGEEWLHKKTRIRGSDGWLINFIKLFNILQGYELLTQSCGSALMMS